MLVSLPPDSEGAHTNRVAALTGLREARWSRRSAYRGDDLAPAGEEARAQRQETVMPVIWTALGILVALLFFALAQLGPHAVIKPTVPISALPAARGLSN